MAVSFQYNEWHDDAGQWRRSYGIQLWEFNEAGLMQRRIASINDVPNCITRQKAAPSTAA